MAVIGGVIRLCLTGVPFSVSAAIGFIALFGVSVMNGIIVLSQYNFLTRRWYGANASHSANWRSSTTTRADDVRHRGRRPAAGGDVDQHRLAGSKPLAIVVVSGMMSAPILILLVLPALMALFPRRRFSARHLRAQPELAE